MLKSILTICGFCFLASCVFAQNASTISDLDSVLAQKIYSKELRSQHDLKRFMNESSIEDKGELVFLKHLGEIYLNINEHDSAFFVGEHLAAQAESLNNSSKWIEGKSIMIRSKMWDDQINEALELCNQTIALIENDEIGRLEIQSLKAMLFDFIGDSELSEELARSTLKAVQPYYQPTIKARLHTLFATYHAKRGRFDLSIQELVLASKQYELSGDFEMMRMNKANMAVCAQFGGDLENAISINKSLLQDSIINTIPDRKGQIYICLADCYHEMNELDSAIFYQLEGIDIYENANLGYNPQSQGYYNSAAQIFEDLGQPKIALEYLKKHLHQVDQMNSSSKNNELARLESDYQKSIRERENNFLREELDKQSQISSLKNLTIVLAIFLIAIVALNFLRFRMKAIQLKEQKQKLNKANAEILHINETLEDKVIERTSELESAYSKLLESEKAARMTNHTIEAADYSTFWLDNSGKFLRANKATLDILNFTAEEISTKKAQELFVVPEFKSFKEFWYATKENKGYKTELKFRDRGKNTIWLESFVHMVEFDGEEMLFGYAHDITQRKIVDNQIQELNFRLENLISHLKGVVYRCHADETWTMAYLSDSVFELTGYRADEIVNNNNIPWRGLIHPADQVSDYETIQLDDSNTFTSTYRIIDKYGSVKWIYEQGVGISDEDGKIKYLEGYIIDVTDRIKREEENLSIILRTEERERKRFAHEIHDGVGQLLTASILNFEGLTQEKSNFNEASVDRFEQGISQLKKAVLEVRQIARNIVPKDVEDYGFVEATRNLVSSLIPLTEIKIEFFENLNGQTLEAAVATNLFRITQEAINNSIKYSNAQLLQIQAIKHEDSIILTVEDDGLGFNPKSLENAPSTMGVISMRSRAKSLGGNFQIDSSPEIGTTITVEIPLGVHEPD